MIGICSKVAVELSVSVRVRPACRSNCDIVEYSRPFVLRALNGVIVSCILSSSKA